MRFAILAIALFAASPVFAQVPAQRGFIGLGIGPSTPFGSFSHASSASTSDGHTDPGYTDTFINLGYRFGERFGIAGAVSYSEYVIGGADTHDWWQVATLTVGPMYTLPLNSRAAIDLKAMAGLIALTPVIDSYTTDDGTGSGLGIDLRTTIRYDIFRHWALFAEGGVQASNASFNTGARTSYKALISGLGVAFRPGW